MAFVESGQKTFLAGAALEARRRVKIKSGTLTDPPEVVYADAGEIMIGVTEYAAASGAPVAVKMISAGGTFEVEVDVDSAIARGTVLYGGADGVLTDASSGSAQAIALEAGADGARIECVVWSVLSTTAATVSILDAGEHTLAATVEAALAEIYDDASNVRSIPVPLTCITQEDGTALTKQATTVAGFAQLANKEVVILIPVDCTAGEALQFTVAAPPDLDATKDIEVKVLAGKDANNDALTLDCEIYPCAAGDVANADIQSEDAQTVTQAASVLTFVGDAAGVLAPPSTLTVVLTLGGTNDGDAVYIYGAWIEYTRTLLSSE